MQDIQKSNIQNVKIQQQKRSELHLHMALMDAINSAELVAQKWGHKAIILQTMVAQSFPDAHAAGKSV